MEDSNDDFITDEPEVILYEPPDQCLQFSSTDQDHDSINNHDDVHIIQFNILISAKKKKSFFFL